MYFERGLILKSAFEGSENFGLLNWIVKIVNLRIAGKQEIRLTPSRGPPSRSKPSKWKTITISNSIWSARSCISLYPLGTFRVLGGAAWPTNSCADFLAIFYSIWL